MNNRTPVESKRPAQGTGRRFPSPGERPEADVVIYDGECRFCESQIERLVRWDTGNRLAFVSLHDPLVAGNYPDLTHEQLMAQMYVVSDDGKRRGGAAAFRFLSRKLPRLWLLAPLLHIPFSLPLWQWAYQRIANRRYKISQSKGQGCDNGTCPIHFDK